MKLPRQEFQVLCHSRRLLLLAALSAAATTTMLSGCSPEPVSFKSTDVTGAGLAKGLRLKDHGGKARTLNDFKGKVVAVFFGFTQSPDVCPTSIATMAEVKRLLDVRTDRLQVLFITVDPDRDSQVVLKAYMQNFDLTFLALRPEPEAQKAVADSFKVYYKRVEARTPTLYAMDHSAGKYIFDTQGRIRLFPSYGTEAAVIAEDIKTLLKSAT